MEVCYKVKYQSIATVYQYTGQKDILKDIELRRDSFLYKAALCTNSVVKCILNGFMQSSILFVCMCLSTTHFAKSYCTPSNSYCTLCVPKHTILGPLTILWFRDKFERPKLSLGFDSHTLAQ